MYLEGKCLYVGQLIYTCIIWCSENLESVADNIYCYQTGCRQTIYYYQTGYRKTIYCYQTGYGNVMWIKVCIKGHVTLKSEYISDNLVGLHVLNNIM